MTFINFMLFILRIICFKPVFAFFWWALHVIFPHKAISGSPGVAHGCCWRTWQLYVHASFTALSSSFFQAISVFFTARLKMPSFFSPPPSPTSFPLVKLKGADKWTDSWIPRYSEGQKKRWSGEMKEWQRVTALGWATEKVEERKEKE